MKIDVQDSSGRILTLDAAPDILLGDLAFDAAEGLQLPLQDRHGRRLSYALFHTARVRFLNPDLTAHGHDLHEGDHLRILPYTFGDFYELELQTQPNPGMLYPVYGRETTIGRDFSNDIVVRHKSVSREHGIFEWVDGFHLYVDLNSANGTWINNQPVTRPTPIGNGDVIAFGQAVQMVYRERRSASDSIEAIDEALGMIEEDGSNTGLMNIPRTEAYVSFSPNQSQVAGLVIENLGKVGIKTWYHESDYHSAMQRAGIMVVILSRDAVASDALQAEWDFFAQLRKPVLPIIYEPVRLPDFVLDAPIQVEYTYNDRVLVGDVIEAVYALLK